MFSISYKHLIKVKKKKKSCEHFCYATISRVEMQPISAFLT